MNITRKSIIFSILLGLCASQMQAVTKYDMDLIQAIQAAQQKTVVYYLNQGADVNTQVGDLKETPLMIAINQAAAEVERFVSAQEGVVQIVGGSLLSGLTAGSLYIMSPALVDEQFKKDLFDVVQGKSGKVVPTLRRGWDTWNEQVDTWTAQPGDASIEGSNLFSYREAKDLIPNVRGRVITLGLAVIALEAGIVYGLFSFLKGHVTLIKSISNRIAQSSRLSVIKTLLATPSINTAFANAKGQTALDIVRSHMVNTKNAKVIAMMKHIETMLLEKN